jgi:uncharacterized repeat protein (TIGR03803 family)
MQRAFVRSFLAVSLLPLTALAAQASTFSVIGSVPGGPQIGAINGKVLYGTIAYSNPPTLFSLTTSGSYKLLHNFNAGTDGSPPNAMLAIDGDGNVFGTTSAGGQYGAGTLFEYSAAKAFTTPHVFGGSGDGINPRQGPAMGPHHTVYGSTAMGAPNNNGIIFGMTHAGSYGMLYNFQSGADGHCPFSGVAVASNGTIYGTTVGVGYGGNPNGSVWKYTAAAGLQTLYVFQDGADDEYPDQAPTVDASGNVYGTTHVYQGSNVAGVVWKISAAGKFSVLHTMNGSTDGFGLNSPLVADKKGNLFGTTGSGGAKNDGTVFRITPAGAFSVVHSFAGGTDGAQPTGNLVRGSSGIYGGTATGAVFKIVP